MECKKQSTFQISFFAALCLFLSAVEYAIPKPLPFLRLGLANLPILLACKISFGENKYFKKTEYLLLICLKILGQAFISGTLFSYIFLFSAAGSFASGIIMIAVYNFICCFKRNNKKELISNIGISLAGSLANNLAQILCARFVIFGENTKYIAPVLLTSGLVTGLVLGIFANFFEEKSLWFRRLKGTVSFESVSNKCGSEYKNNKYLNIKQKTRLINENNIWFIISLLSMFVFFFIKEIYILWIAVFLFFILACYRKKKIVKVIPSIVITVTVTFFALLSPYGKVLFTLGSWRITEDALFSGLHRSGILVGMVFLSQCAVSKNIKLPGRVGKFLTSMFKIFDKLTSKRVEIKPGKIISSIDERLCEISDSLILDNSFSEKV